MSCHGEKTNPRWDRPSSARQFLKVGMTAGILSGTSAALVVADQPADAAGTPTPAASMADLVSTVPRVSLVSLEPGQTKDTVDLAWVEKELGTPGLSQQEVSFLERDVPVAVTQRTSIGAPPAGTAAVGLAANDPVMSDSCTWTDLAGGPGRRFLQLTASGLHGGDLRSRDELPAVRLRLLDHERVQLLRVMAR